MRPIRNHNKISGKKMNSVIRKAEMFGDIVPLKRNAKLIDDAHISMVNIPNSPLGVSDDGALEVSHIKGVFADSDEMDVHVDHLSMTVKMGKNEYWFQVVDQLTEPKIPVIDSFTTDFEVNPTELAKFCKGHKTGFVRLVATHDKTGKKTVFAFLYEEDGTLVGGMDLHSVWNGEEIANTYPAERFLKMDAFGTKGRIQTSESYPFQMSGKDDSGEYTYFVAPRIGEEGMHNFRDKEKNWIASHNKKLFKWWNRKS